MYVRNAKEHTINFNYRVNGQAKHVKIAPNTIVNFPTITSVNEIIFDPLERTQREVAASLVEQLILGLSTE